MNGFKKAARRQAAVVGLATLMGATFLGCHSGPKLFTKKSREDSAAKRELADKDKGKFINRKKVRPESDYRRDDAEQQVAKTDSKKKASDSSRKSANDEVERAVTARKTVDPASSKNSQSAKSTTVESKSADAGRSEIARRDSSRRTVTDLLDDPIFDKKMPESRSNSKDLAATKLSSNLSVPKTKSIDDDPFKDSVVGKAPVTRPNNKVATVNFDDDDLDDEMEEEAEELEELRAQSTKSLVKAPSGTQSIERPASQITAQDKRKFLDEIEEESALTNKSNLRLKPSQLADRVDAHRSDLKLTERTADATTSPSAKTVAGQQVLDRRQNVQQTLKDWRREMDEQESSAEAIEEARAPTPRTAVASRGTSAAKSHISQTSIQEFAPAKSQGAVLNGDLIIDTANLPTRFQRSPESSAGLNNANSSNGRMSSNSGANIEVIPGATQNRTRPAGQISLQSLADEDGNSGLTTAGYEERDAGENLGGLPRLTLKQESDVGPSLTPLEESDAAPIPPEIITERASASKSATSHGWARPLLIIGAMFSAVLIGFGLRRRMQLVPQPVRFAKGPTEENPKHPSSWPHG